MINRRRKRGIILSSHGYQRLLDAKQDLEDKENYGDRFTLEELAARTSLSLGTITKIFNHDAPVDKSSLQRCFRAFKLELNSSDITTPESPSVDITNPVSPVGQYQDWGEAINVQNFQGRYTELTCLHQWIVLDRCRLVTLLGMGGIGKTSLSVKLAQQLQTEFEYILWRSLRNAPSLETLLTDFMQVFSHPQDQRPNVRDLLHYLRSYRCLIVLDNVETLLQEGDQAGSYCPGYGGYGDLFQQMGEGNHQSCLLLTSREKPAEIAALEGDEFVRSFVLQGCPEAARAVLDAKGIVGSDVQKQLLCDRYQSSPLALKLVATSLQEVFDGNIDAMLAQETTIFSGIRRLLDHQFARLTDIEKSLTYWLAINRDWTSLEDLEADLYPALARPDLLEALESLKRRCLVETASPPWREAIACFSLQSVVMEYAIQSLIKEISHELITDNSPKRYLNHYALLKVNATDQVQDIQHRLILDALLHDLQRLLGSRDAIKARLLQLLHSVRLRPEPGYLAGNLLNLLIRLHADLSGLDLSNLFLWQTDFRSVNLQRVNLQGANLSNILFLKTFASVYAIAFSPDGTRLATGHGDGAVRLWQIADGQLLSCFLGHSSSVWTIAFSPDGQTLASGSFDTSIRLWDVETETLRHTLVGHHEWVQAIAFSPEGQLLVSGSSDRTLYLWDVKTGEAKQQLYGHDDAVTTVGFFPNGQRCISGSEDSTLRIWDIASGTCEAVLSGHNDLVSSVSVSPKGDRIASSDPHQIKIWQVPTYHCTHTIQAQYTSVWAIAFSPDGETLATGDSQSLTLWNVATGIPEQVLATQASQIWAVAFSPCGYYLAWGDDRTVGLWDLERGQIYRTWRSYSESMGSVGAIAISPDASTLATGSSDHSVRLWDCRTGSCLQTLEKQTQSIRSLAFSPDGIWIASGSDDGTLYLWNLQRGTSHALLPHHSHTVWSVAFSADSRLLASGSTDGVVRLWNVQRDRLLRSLAEHTDPVLSVAFHPTQSIVASSSRDRTIKLWNTETGECQATLTEHQGWIWSIAFSPDGRYLASAGEDRTIRLWDTQTYRCIQTVSGHHKLMWALCFSPDSRTLVSGSIDQTVRLWDIPSGTLRYTFEGETNLVWAFQFTSQSHLLAGSCSSSLIHLWNVDTHTCVQTFRDAKPYEDMNIASISGLTSAAIANLKALGAIET